MEEKRCMKANYSVCLSLKSSLQNLIPNPNSNLIQYDVASQTRIKRSNKYFCFIYVMRLFLEM